MYSGLTIGVVVPAYNEEGFVGKVIETVPSFVDRVYAIDDASSDGTWREIRATARRENEGEGAVGERALASGGQTVFDEPVIALRNAENRGVGGSIKRGYARALEDGIDVVAVLNGDGQMDPAFLDRILDPVVEGHADFAKGNRLLAREFREGMSRWRLFGNAVLTLLTKIASGYWKTMDPQNGYTAISAATLETIGLETLYEGYGFCNDLLITLNVHGMRVADVTIPAVYGEESSSIIYSRFIPRVSGLLLRRFLWRLKVKYLISDFHPVAFLYYLGAITTAIGAGAVIRTDHTSHRTLDSGSGLFVRLLASLQLFLGGMLTLVVAMILDMRANDHLEGQFNNCDHDCDHGYDHD